MVILVDTNVILDFLVKREPYFESAKKVMQLCAEEKVKADYVVARNIADYSESEIKAIEPDALLQIVNQ